MSETDQNSAENKTGSSQAGLAGTRFVEALKKRPTLTLSLLSSVLMWLALPPADLWPLAWVAPVPWLLLIRQQTLAGRRPYRTIWFAGFVFWLLSLHWLRLPFPETHLGWLALAFYLAFYLPIFVGSTRVAVHRLKIPLFLAATIAWTGLELVRAYMISGFLMAEIAHTQLHWPMLIQISDLGGSYAVDFVILLTASCIALAWPWEGSSIRLPALAPAAILIPIVLVYGNWRQQAKPASESLPGPMVALVQGNITPELKGDPKFKQKIIEKYATLSRQAVDKAKEGERLLDLIVWPETMYGDPLVLLADDFTPEGAPEDLVQKLDNRQERSRQSFANLLAYLETPAILGIVTVNFHSLEDYDNDRCNAAVAFDRSGEIVDCYEKTHLVMFGEYVPFADWIPGLYKLTPLAGGLTPGESPTSMTLGGVNYAPNICYESVLPHLIRRHVLELTEQGDPPDVLVNLTNDGWYYGSSELDMHLACSVFRAIECRKPILVAANTGLTAWIDADGRIRSVLDRDIEGVLIAEVELDDRESWYLQNGDWFSGGCLIVTTLIMLVGILTQRRQQKSSHRERSGV